MAASKDAFDRFLNSERVNALIVDDTLREQGQKKWAPTIGPSSHAFHQRSTSLMTSRRSARRRRLAAMRRILRRAGVFEAGYHQESFFVRGFMSLSPPSRGAALIIHPR